MITFSKQELCSLFFILRRLYLDDKGVCSFWVRRKTQVHLHSLNKVLFFIELITIYLWVQTSVSHSTVRNIEPNQFSIVHANLKLCHPKSESFPCDNAWWMKYTCTFLCNLRQVNVWVIYVEVQICRDCWTLLSIVND